MINGLLHPKLIFIRLIRIRKISQIIINMSNHFFFLFQYIYILLKILADNSICSICEICSIITVRFYFVFQKNLSLTGSPSNSLLIFALAFSEIVAYFPNKSSSPVKRYISFDHNNFLHTNLF